MLLVAGWLALIVAINLAASADLLEENMMWGIGIASLFIATLVFAFLREVLDDLEIVRRKNDEDDPASA